MPHYNAWGAASQHASRLPPTPPEYSGAYMTPTSAMVDSSFYPVNGYHSRHGSVREHSERYHQNQPYNGQHSSHAHPRMNLSYDGYAQGPYPYAAPAPILPPIRAPVAIDPFQYAPQEKKEEKPTGGVAQHLDYEMDVMSCFVAEMAQKLIIPGSEPPREFRKYVQQILSSTRLPSSTIMLGLFYLATRMKMVKQQPEVSGSGLVYRMLTTCLLLGSKFLDDNTFQNKSWAEVSSIPVVELNMMELDWLQGFNWEIHTLMYEEDESFFDWIEHWHMYETKAKNRKAKEMHKLAPIETKFSSRFSPQHIVMSPEGPIPPQYQQGSQYDTQWARQYMSEYSPPSAPHSGPATPEYYAQNQWSAPLQPLPRSGYNNFNNGFHPQPTYQPYSYQQTWAHGSNCGCGMCAKHSDFYFHGGYPVQPVVG